MTYRDPITLRASDLAMVLSTINATLTAQGSLIARRDTTAIESMDLRADLYRARVVIAMLIDKLPSTPVRVIE